MIFLCILFFIGWLENSKMESRKIQKKKKEKKPFVTESDL